MVTFNVTPYLTELSQRVETIRRLVIAAHPPVTEDHTEQPDISREVRGMAIVLLFASYEHLLKTLVRGLLETAKSIGLSNESLKPELRMFAVYSALQSLTDKPDYRTRIWTDGPRLLELAANSRDSTLDTNRWPDDGSFMKTPQVRLVCDLFGLGDPALILREVWGRLDTIVTQRNNIAHGLEMPEEVGRRYTLSELNDLIDRWETRWSDFVRHIGATASTPDFFRRNR